MTRIIFIRHARSVQNKAVGPSNWTISQAGEEEIKQLALERLIQGIEVLFCSTELKARLTAERLCSFLVPKTIAGPICDKQFNEVDRDNGPFFASEEEFRNVVRSSFEHRSVSEFTWEPAQVALERFTAGVNNLLDNPFYKTKTIGIVSHGTVLSLYFASIGKYFEKPDLVYKKWLALPFCAWGVIEDNQIIREVA